MWTSRRTLGHILFSPLLYTGAETEAQGGKVTHSTSHCDLEPIKVSTFSQPETSSWVWHYLPCLSNVQFYSKDLNIKVLLLRIRSISPSVARAHHSKGCHLKGWGDWRGVPWNTGSSLHNKTVPQVPSSTSKAPSGLSHFITAKTLGETEETLELKGNLKTMNPISLVDRWGSEESESLTDFWVTQLVTVKLLRHCFHDNEFPSSDFDFVIAIAN